MRARIRLAHSRFFHAHGGSSLELSLVLLSERNRSADRSRASACSHAAHSLRARVRARAHTHTHAHARTHTGADRHSKAPGSIGGTPIHRACCRSGSPLSRPHSPRRTHARVRAHAPPRMRRTHRPASSSRELTGSNEGLDDVAVHRRRRRRRRRRLKIPRPPITRAKRPFTPRSRRAVHASSSSVVRAAGGGGGTPLDGDDGAGTSPLPLSSAPLSSFLAARERVPPALPLLRIHRRKHARVERESTRPLMYARSGRPCRPC